jgi:hypothetical protein
MEPIDARLETKLAADVLRASDKLADARGKRDAYICQRAAAGDSKARLARSFGMTREALYKILRRR